MITRNDDWVRHQQRRQLQTRRVLLSANVCQQMSKVIWQKAASPTCHPSRLRMDSSDLDLQYMVPWTNMTVRPRRHFDLFSHFCIAHPCTRHTDTQTTLRATSVAMSRISCTACRRCGPIMTVTETLGFESK